MTRSGQLTAASDQFGVFAPIGSTGRPGEARWSLLEACRRMWRARRTRTELAALSDLELRDIGLHRCDIERVAVENYN